MQLPLLPVWSVTACLLLGAVSDVASAADQSEHAGKISGTVVSAATGEPIAGAYVGIGDFGDAGGANLERFRKQGRYATTETDAQGRFVLQGVAVPGEHPLVVTHPESVRHDQTIVLGDVPSVGHANAPPNGRAIEVNISLKPGATVHVTAAHVDGNTLDGSILIRLEALDGHLFIPPGRNPHLSAFASSVWTARAKTGAFSFTELDAGEYALDVIRLGESQTVYHGGLSPVVVGTGDTKSVRIGPADHHTKVTIKIPKSPPDVQISPFLLVSRNPGLLLWYDRKAHSLEDPRLGRLVHQALFFRPVQSGSVQTLVNLPPGMYSVFAGVPICMAGVRMDVAQGDELTLDIPRVEPDGLAEVNLWRLRRRVKLEARAYTTRELCELLTVNNDHQVRFRTDASIQNESVGLGPASMSMWDLIEKLYLEKGWRLEEEDRQSMVLLPDSTAKKPNETH